MTSSESTGSRVTGQIIGPSTSRCGRSAASGRSSRARTSGTLLGGLDLHDGDVVLVTSKIVSKAEGRVRQGDRAAAIRDETVRVVARRGPTSIVENRLGIVMAAAGVDASNVSPGHVVLLPEDPDASARALRQGVYDDLGRNVAVVLTDTAGRAWRTGQTDLAVGVAGIEPLDHLAGSTDSYGNRLEVTAPAVADELAAAAELVAGKLGGRPISVVRGLAGRVLPTGEHGPGARALLRPRAEDMFALGAREAVMAAVRGRDPDCSEPPLPPRRSVARWSPAAWPPRRTACRFGSGSPGPTNVR